MKQLSLLPNVPDGPDAPWPGLDPAQAAEVVPDRIKVMWRMYGTLDKATCGQCRHLLAHRQSATWYKCELSHMSACAATDWRKRWTACGKFEPC